MKAMIFAAGKGKRLHPVTKDKPKALVKAGGKTLLEHAIEKLAEAGFRDIIINTHHFSDQIREFIEKKHLAGINLTISDESDLLLDTGGGLKKAQWFFDNNSPFLAYNVDIISDINLENMLDFHLQSEAMATLAVLNRQTSRYLLFDNNYKLHGWRNHNTGEKKIPTDTHKELYELAFSGLQILSPELFKYFPDKKVFSVIDVYTSLSKNIPISGYLHNNKNWFDVGTQEKLSRAEKYLKDI